MINIYYIHRFPFNKEAFIRDEFEYLSNKGFNVKYIEISNLLKKAKFESTCPPELQKYVVPINSKKEYVQFICNQKDAIIITDVGLLSNSAWMYLPIFKSNIPYLLFENTSLPSIVIKKSLEDRKRGFIKFFKSIKVKKMIQKPADIIQYYKALSVLKPANLIITSKSKLRAEKQALKGSETKLKYSMSFDYKVASGLGDKRTVEGDYAVFVDQYFVHHPDFKTNHIVHSFTAEQYYGELNEYFDYFAKSTGLKVVIASHPRRKLELTNDFDKGYDLYYNKTAELIKNSKIVLQHFSTSINFAVIFNKPFILLTSKLFHDSNILSGISMFSKFFEKPMMDMKNRTTIDILQEENSMNKAKYTEFLERYIKHPKAVDESFRDMIVNEITKITS